MIIKVDLFGEDYYSLLGWLKSDENHFDEKNYGSDSVCRPTTRTPFVKLLSAKTDSRWSEREALMSHKVVLEVKEDGYTDVEGGYMRVLLSVLAGLFSSMDLYPATQDVPSEEEEVAE